MIRRYVQTMSPAQIDTLSSNISVRTLIFLRIAPRFHRLFE